MMVGDGCSAFGIFYILLCMMNGEAALWQICVGVFIYFTKGLVPAVLGIVAGLTLGHLCGESLCGMVLKSLGADSFRFVINWGQVMAGIPIVILGAAILAVWAGISQIGQIKAYECCRGKE